MPWNAQRPSRKTTSTKTVNVKVFRQRRRCSLRTSLTEKFQDIADRCRWADALESSATDDVENGVRRGSDPARRQHLRTLPRVRDLPADRTQVAQAIPRPGILGPRGAESPPQLESGHDERAGSKGRLGATR